VSNVRGDMECHRQAIGYCLTVLGRYMLQLIKPLESSRLNFRLGVGLSNDPWNADD